MGSAGGAAGKMAGAHSAPRWVLRLGKLLRGAVGLEGFAAGAGGALPAGRAAHSLLWCGVAGC